MNPIIAKAWFKQSNYKLLFKQAVKENADCLRQQFDPQHSVKDLLNDKSDFIDNLLTLSWQFFLGDVAEKLALIAVGGYARRELFPHSDIDVVILLNTDDIADYQDDLTDFLTFLWDIGLKLSQSVRTIQECITAAVDDQTIMTSLMENRLIAGNPVLLENLNAEISPDKIWPSDKFFEAKMLEQKLRHAKYHDTAYNLEPNIKEGPGGLRDMQVITWVFKRHYNSKTLKELIKYDFLPASEYDQLINALRILWRIRYALHLLTNRSEDRLIFDYQRDLAKQFGFESDNTQFNQDVEQFMQFYFKTILELQRLNEMLLQLFNERFVIGQSNMTPEPLNNHFVVINNYLEAVNDKVFEEQPLALLEVFLILQKNTRLKGVRATTIRLVRKNLHLIDAEFRSNKVANYLFMEIFRQPVGITSQLRRMNRYGILAAYLPSFANIVARMQYDLFHIYTVDEHTLFVIRNLRRFSLDRHRDELPFCNDVFEHINKPEILYLAAMFHDIAKGRNGDHSTLGEEIARDFCVQHDISAHDTKLITWLVRHHLVMSMTAQRKDISDPDVIHEFAQKVGSTEYLNHLYLLTVADIRATNPELWNSWKDSLLMELYKATHSALRRGLKNPLALSERINEHKLEAKDELLALGIGQDYLDKFWLNMNDDYFLRYSAEEIVWHTHALINVQSCDLPLVMLRTLVRRGNAEIFIFAENKGSLFSICTATLDQLGLNILDARIMTTKDNYALDSFQILEQSGLPIKDSYRINHICNAIRNNIINQEVKEHKNIHRQSRQAKHFPIPTVVNFQDNPNNHQTVLELITTDHSGLLSKVGRIFNKLHITLHNARITTIGSRVEDMFYITDTFDRPITDPDLQEQLRNDIVTALNNPYRA
jgi:[protein-PII] uridylyltransferase